MAPPISHEIGSGLPTLGTSGALQGTSAVVVATFGAALLFVSFISELSFLSSPGVWRRGRDSNPRKLSLQRFSRPPHSTTLPPLRCGAKTYVNWQDGRDSNPQQTVLETVALPIELPPYSGFVSFPRATPYRPRKKRITRRPRPHGPSLLYGHPRE